MAVKSREDLIKAISGIVGEEPDENGIALLEDVEDTINNYEERTKEDWKTKYEENDKSWRKRYTERFMKGSDNPPPDDEEDESEDNSPKTFADLFKTED